MSDSNSMPIATAATLAVICEVTAPKPGNVHRGADFDDLTYFDFIHSAVLVGPVLERTLKLGVGPAVLESVCVTRDAVGTNTNLGTLLLLAPLASVANCARHADGMGDVLCELSVADTRYVYEAIRIAAAGGLGRVEEADVFDDPSPELTLVDAMQLAGERDLVARQYCNAFADVFRIAAWIENGLERGWLLDRAIVHAYIRQLAAEPDSLILRKCGPQTAQQAAAMASRLLDAGLPGSDAFDRGLADFDFWLRADGHRRNPGTTADLIAAAMYVLLREGRVRLKR